MPDVRLEVRDLCYSYSGADNAADHVSFHVDKGSFVGLIGPNGSGKSTVLKNIYRALRPDGGSITLDGEDLLKMSHRESALKLAVVGQENELPFDFTVEEIVAMGRSPHKKLFDTDTAQDKAIVHHALEHLGMADMAKRSYLNLSGGKNIFDDIDSKQWVTVTYEEALARKPDVILIHDYDSPGVDEKLAEIKANPTLAKLDCVKNERFATITLESVLPGDRIAYAVETLAKAFYPDVFE